VRRQDSHSLRGTIPQPGPRLLNALSLLALLVALGSFIDRVLWWTHKQFRDCLVQTERPQPPYCVVSSELEWIVWYGPCVSLVIALLVLQWRSQKWHSRPFTPVVVLWLSVLMLIRTVFVMVVAFALRHMN
jgi:hypothetical protein